MLALAGCAKLDLDEGFTLWKSDPQPQTPERLAAVWTETTLHQPGKPVVRGFGGRILFHGSDEQQAVLVEGNVIVYAYDNDRPNQEDPAPDKKFVFPAENLAKHSSDSSLGPSYSFWLPWDNAGGPQRRISLLTRFEDKSGKIVMSQMAHVTLPGPVAPPQGNSGLTQFPQHLPNRTTPSGTGPESLAHGSAARLASASRCRPLSCRVSSRLRTRQRQRNPVGPAVPRPPSEHGP